MLKLVQVLVLDVPFLSCSLSRDTRRRKNARRKSNATAMQPTPSPIFSPSESEGERACCTSLSVVLTTAELVVMDPVASMLVFVVFGLVADIS